MKTPMRGNGLRYLEAFSFWRNPQAALWNAMIGEVRQRLPSQLSVETPGTGTHCWQTRAQLWADAPADDPARDRTYRVDVRTGFVNDVPATIIYQKDDDERGWEMPDGYPVPKATPEARFVDRPLYEREEPPFLLVTAPKKEAKAGAEDAGSGFRSVADGFRPEFFRTEEMWERALFKSSVYVSADPTVAQRALPYFTLTRILRQYRVFAGVLPGQAPARAGGVRSLATLWLTREADGDPAGDTMYVQQLEYYDLWQLVAQPGAGLLDIAALIQGDLNGDILSALTTGNGVGVLGDIIGSGIEATLDDTAQVFWWSAG